MTPALFEPIAIGPKVLRNRFIQVPQCTGAGWRSPGANAAHREIKAEGGWAAVCTESCSVHPEVDQTVSTVQSLWDEGDVINHRHMTDSVHRWGALAGVELFHAGGLSDNLATRRVPTSYHQFQSPGMPATYGLEATTEDLERVVVMHVEAAKRAVQAGFDIIYIYAADDLELLQFFLSRRRNHRDDEYGGVLANRTRLLREVIEDTKDAVGDTCAVAVRITIDEMSGPDGICAGSEGRDIIASLAELPDAWDVKVSGWSNDSETSRFKQEGYQEPYACYIKQVTTKPVIGTGRFTSPDTMASQVKRGILDVIGCARPSIADPFLPKKVEEGRIEDIRECIGCNICVSTYNLGAPINCTQNPTIGEEYKRGWHPERYRPAGSADAVLIVGAGPAGLECAQALGRRGYQVHLAEAGRELGGRVLRESRLHGLGEWIRVRDWRAGQLDRMANVSVYRESAMTEDDVLAMEAPTVILATGATWRRDGFGRRNHKPVPAEPGAVMLSPDDVMDGVAIEGPVLVFDDDDYYMGGVLAETLRKRGLEVTLVTPSPLVSAWTVNTLEQEKIQRQVLEAGITVMANSNLAAVRPGAADLACVFTGRQQTVAAASVVLVTARRPRADLYDALAAQVGQGSLRTLLRIGDCFQPGTIATAVFGGRRAAEGLDQPKADIIGFRTEPVATERPLSQSTPRLRAAE